MLGMLQPRTGKIEYSSHEQIFSVEEIPFLTAYVPQGYSLFEGTIEENIKMGCPGASHHEVVQAARRAHAHAFITHLPQGYETEIGSGKVQLSEGEAQRLAIARALLKGAPVLIMDEPSSSLDADSEQALVEMLENLKGKTTCIYVSHSPELFKAADRIISLEGGRAVELESGLEVSGRGAQ